MHAMRTQTHREMLTVTTDCLHRYDCCDNDEDDDCYNNKEFTSIPIANTPCGGATSM